MSPHSASLSLTSFQTRAALYGRLDAQLRQKTRFFGAAALTNRVLACLTTVRAALCSQATCDWLCSIGGCLEARNVGLAKQIGHRQLAGPTLDRELVAVEQSVVEAVLGGARRVDAAALAEINALLNHWYRAALICPRADLRGYARVLATVRRELASPIDFGQQRHRETIGLALIAALRQRESNQVIRPDAGPCAG